MVRNTHEASRALLRGGIAGLFAGVALTAFMTVMASSHGRDIWYGMKGAAYPFFGTRALVPGYDFEPVAVGLGAHLFISAAWGALFALFAWGLRRAGTIVLGIAWAFVVWIGMYYVVLPVFGMAFMRADAPPKRAIAFHLFYSVVMTVAYLAVQAVASGDQRRFRRHAHVH